MSAIVLVLKVIFSPFILLYYSTVNYFFPCVNSYFRRTARACYCTACKCCQFKDKKFPPTDKSMGPKHADQADWRRVRDLKQANVLFPPKIRPSDVQQGGVGNCWLISAFACLAERKGTIQRCFYTKEASSRGKYKLRIYNRMTEKWEKVLVDDYVPVKKGTNQPLFATPNGEEFWPMILEKAFAKYCGSYENLSGGITAWAMEAMTGDKVFKISRERLGGHWYRFDLVTPTNPKTKRSIGITKKNDPYTVEKLFDILYEYDAAEALIAASSESGNDSAAEAVRGIVQGHAYSVLKVRKVKDFRMVQLRNPWGQFEWTGAWSDSSPLWRQHTQVLTTSFFLCLSLGTPFRSAPCQILEPKPPDPRPPMERLLAWNGFGPK